MIREHCTAEHAGPTRRPVVLRLGHPNAVRAFSAKRIDGKMVADAVVAEIQGDVDELTEQLGRPPGLAVVLVGARKDSATYVKMKKKRAIECGFKSVEKVLDEDVSQGELLNVVTELNDDPTIDGILVQLPLPDHVDQKTVLEAIEIGKDVDGSTPTMWARLCRGETLRQRPRAVRVYGQHPVHSTWVLELIKRTGIDLNGKHVVILGRSNIVGLRLPSVLAQECYCCHVPQPYQEHQGRMSPRRRYNCCNEWVVKGDWSSRVHASSMLE